MRLSLLTLLLAPLALTSGCRASAHEPKPAYTVGVSLLTKTHPFYKQLEQGLRQEAAAARVELRVQSAELDTAMQTAQLENFVVQQVDAIVLCPVDSQAIGGAIARVNAAGIPLFTADIRSSQGHIVSHIASNNIEGGAAIARYLAHALGGKGKVAILDQPEVASVQERVRGFTQALARFPQIELVAKPSGGGVRDQAATTMENLLQAHPDLNGVFGINDNSALGAISVLAARGRTDVRVVGFDADDEARAAMRKGLLLADAVQYPNRIGRRTLQTVLAHLRGQAVPAEVAIETGVLDRAGLETAAP